MIQVLKANQTQYEALNGYKNGSSELEFIQDANDNWIVGQAVLSDPNFLAIRPRLNELELILFNQKQEPI